MPKKIVITKLGGPEVLKYVKYELPNTRNGKFLQCNNLF